MVWHHDRPFELALDVPKKTLLFSRGAPWGAGALADVPGPQSLREGAPVGPELPEHRRVNPAKARVALGNKGGAVSVALTVKDGDFEYATRKAIHIVHEIFLIFLEDGPYFEYMVEQLGLDPDRY